jgi:hypothetical protein
MPRPQPAKLALDHDALIAALGGADADDPIVATLAAAVELANTAGDLAAFAPGDLDPVVLRRYRLAELTAARDAFIDAAGDLLVGEVPDAAT